MEKQNIHRVPPCPKCGGPMKVGKTGGGMKAHCINYAYCGGMLHIPTQSQSAIAISGGNAEGGTPSLDDSKKIENSDSGEGLPSPGSANYERMKHG